MNIIELPNFSDPRVARKCKKVALFAANVLLNPSSSTTLSIHKLRAVVGNSSVNPRDAFYENLFERFGSYSKEHGRPYSYRVRRERLDTFCRVARLPTILGESSRENPTSHHPTDGAAMLVIVEAAKKRGFDFSSPPPKLKDYRHITGNRHYDWWHNIRGPVRRELFLAEHGVLYEYDIDTAKQSLLLQQFDKWLSSAGTTANGTLLTWRDYVSNKVQFRRELAKELNITVDEAKKIVQMLLNSAFPALHQNNGFVVAFGWDVTSAMLESRTCQALRRDWQQFASVLSALPMGRGDKGTRITAGQAATRIYNEVEQSVMLEIEKHVKGDVWFLHDGFFTSFEQDIQNLELEVKKNTKTTVALSCSQRSAAPSVGWWEVGKNGY